MLQFINVINNLNFTIKIIKNSQLIKNPNNKIVKKQNKCIA